MRNLLSLTSKTTFILILSFGLISSAFAGGDVIGGGHVRRLKKEFKLTKLEEAKLKKSKSIEDAYIKWQMSLNPDDRMIIMEKVFQHLIAPQIEKN